MGVLCSLGVQRLRLQAFIDHYVSQPRRALDGSRGGDARDSTLCQSPDINGMQACSSEPVLQAFLSEVSAVLAMHVAAVQALMTPDADTLCQSKAPASLLELVVHLEGINLQLKQLGSLCRCEPVQSGNESCDRWSSQLSAGREHGRCSPAASAPVAWPGQAAHWAAEWQLEPCEWQAAGFPLGAKLLDHIYAGARPCAAQAGLMSVTLLAATKPADAGQSPLLTSQRSSLPVPCHPAVQSSCMRRRRRSRCFFTFFRQLYSPSCSLCGAGCTSPPGPPPPLPARTPGRKWLHGRTRAQNPAGGSLSAQACFRRFR